jgi:hypothetical protein
MKAVRWEDTKRQIRELNPDWDAPEREEARERSRAALRAEQAHPGSGRCSDGRLPGPCLPD